MIGWLIDRRRRRDERRAEERLRHLAEVYRGREVYVPAPVVATLGQTRVRLIVSEYDGTVARRPL